MLFLKNISGSFKTLKVTDYWDAGPKHWVSWDWKGEKIKTFRMSKLQRLGLRKRGRLHQNSNPTEVGDDLITAVDF